MKNIYLIGFMGAGKTTVAKRLASKLNKNFVDTDQLIEVKNKMSISDIFNHFGEPEFRKMEHLTLTELVKSSNLVVSTGGGMSCDLDNLSLMKRNGVVIYLKLAPESILSRLVNAKVKRPLLEGKNEQELMDYITDKLNEREFYYAQAHYTFKGESLDLKNILGVLDAD